jgi:hypothetical protein
MIHSRPGFATRTSEDEVANLNADMIPALHRNRDKQEGEPKNSSSLKQVLDARTDAASKSIQAARDALHLAEMQAAANKVGPDLLINPTPSDTPIITDPHK